MQDRMHERRILELHTHAELVPEETLITLDVALPIGVLPLPIASVVLGHALSLTDTTLGRADPLDHCLVDPRVGDTEVGVVEGRVLNILATKLGGHRDVGKNTNQTGPSGRIVRIEGREGRIIRPIHIQANTVNVVTESVVSDNTINTKGVLKLFVIEVANRLPPSTGLLGILPKLTKDTGIRNDDFKERATSGLTHIKTIGIIFTLEVDEDVIKRVEREKTDVVKLVCRELHIDIAHVEGTLVRTLKGLNDEHLIVRGHAANKGLTIADRNPLVSSTTDPVGTGELLMDVLGDVDVGSHDVIHLLLWEEAIHEIGKLIPIGTHSLGEEAERIAFRAGVSNRLKLNVIRILDATSTLDLLPRLIWIVPTATEAECFLSRESIQRPSLGFETTIINTVYGHLLDEEWVIVGAGFPKQGVHILTARECYSVLCHIDRVLVVFVLDLFNHKKGSLPFVVGLCDPAYRVIASYLSIIDSCLGTPLLFLNRSYPI